MCLLTFWLPSAHLLDILVLSRGTRNWQVLYKYEVAGFGYCIGPTVSELFDCNDMFSVITMTMYPLSWMFLVPSETVGTLRGARCCPQRGNERDREIQQSKYLSWKIYTWGNNHDSTSIRWRSCCSDGCWDTSACWGPAIWWSRPKIGLAMWSRHGCWDGNVQRHQPESTVVFDP